LVNVKLIKALTQSAMVENPIDLFTTWLIAVTTMQRGIASLLFLLFLGTPSSLFAQSCLTLFSFDDGTVQEWQYGTSSNYSGSFATSIGVAQSHASTGSYSLQLGFNNMGGKEYAVYYVESSGGWSLSAYQAIKFNLDLSETSTN
jgi:hypothetical protein